jgi:hypothetical protein
MITAGIRAFPQKITSTSADTLAWPVNHANNFHSSLELPPCMVKANAW